VLGVVDVSGDMLERTLVTSVIVVISVLSVVNVSKLLPEKGTFVAIVDLVKEKDADACLLVRTLS
jgi:hypothetical protein